MSEETFSVAYEIQSEELDFLIDAYPSKDAWLQSAGLERDGNRLTFNGSDLSRKAYIRHLDFYSHAETARNNYVDGCGCDYDDDCDCLEIESEGVLVTWNDTRRLIDDYFTVTNYPPTWGPQLESRIVWPEEGDEQWQ